MWKCESEFFLLLSSDVYNDVDEKYLDLTCYLFDLELDFDGSMIDKVKNLKEEAS